VNNGAGWELTQMLAMHGYGRHPSSLVEWTAGTPTIKKLAATVAASYYGQQRIE
jgi:hypothetical protein